MFQFLENLLNLILPFSWIYVSGEDFLKKAFCTTLLQPFSKSKWTLTFVVKYAVIAI